MPQKAVFSRLPLLDCIQSPLSNGLVRSDRNELIQLYNRLNDRPEDPVGWEGAFSLACLVREKPMEEPVAGRILSAMAGIVSGNESAVSFPDQIRTARAALAVYEYNTDKNILRQLADWCRMLEAEWDAHVHDRWIRVQPADLMEFLVRFYRITGLKAVLRLCARLRAAAMDWTSVLNNFSQRSPLKQLDMEAELKALFSADPVTDADYFKTQYLINHAEILADGMRYCAASAAYSGSGPELNAGQKGWEFLKKYHGAVCGGTTASMLLAGRGADAGIHPAAVAAWTEAMAAQADLAGHPWAMNELTVLIFNALADCLERLENVDRFCFVNALDDSGNRKCMDPEAGSERNSQVLARLARATACVWKHAITAAPDGVRINFLLPGRYMIHTGGQNAIFLAEKDSVHLRCKGDLTMNLSLFCAATETADIVLQSGEKTDRVLYADEMQDKAGILIRVSRTWRNLDTLMFYQGDTIQQKETNHQGVCFFMRNRLMALAVRDSEYRYAVCGSPEIRGGQAFVPVRRISRWPSAMGVPADIPVLPSGEGETMMAPLQPYAGIRARIAVFPRERAHG